MIFFRCINVVAPYVSKGKRTKGPRAEGISKSNITLVSYTQATREANEARRDFGFADAMHSAESARARWARPSRNFVISVQTCQGVGRTNDDSMERLASRILAGGPPSSSCSFSRNASLSLDYPGSPAVKLSSLRVPFETRFRMGEKTKDSRPNDRLLHLGPQKKKKKIRHLNSIYCVSHHFVLDRIDFR